MVKIFGKKYPIRKLLLFVTEGIFLVSSLAAVEIFKNNGDPQILFDKFLWLRLLFIVSVCQICLYYNELYSFKGKISFIEMSTRLGQAIGVACVLLGVVFFLFPAMLPPKQIFVTSLLVFMAMSSLWRYGYSSMLARQCCAEPVMVVGMGEFLNDVIREIKDNIDCGYKIAAAVVPPTAKEPDTDGYPIFHSFTNLMDRVQECGATSIIVAMDEKRGNLPYDELLECKMRGLEIIEGETFFEELTGRLLVDKINPSWLIFKEGFVKSHGTAAMKRVVGFLISFLGLTISSPVILLTAMLIKLDSPGPVFFVQERVGKDGKTFPIIKFRSMRTDAEKDGAKWAKENDDRVTRVGRIIRKLRIDEIPQMWNVLRGDMSFVGPRPERPVFVKELNQKIRYYSQRHTVSPGITGWAQINYPYGASVEDAKKKLEYDLYYIKHMSVMLDLYIILKTVRTIIFKMGSR